MLNATDISVTSTTSLNNLIIPSTYIIAASSTVVISNISSIINKTNSSDIIKSISNSAYKLTNYLSSFYIFSNLSMLFTSYNYLT
jgi:hypothetical protein